MRAVVRLAEPADGAGVQAIYAPIVRDTAISFEVDPPSVEEMARRIDSTLERWPWLVCADEGTVLGYVYASRHRERAAYRWSVDVTAYIHESARRRGIGHALYTALLAMLAAQGYHRAYAGITLPNAASVGLHESLGFTPVGSTRRWAGSSGTGTTWAGGSAPCAHRRGTPPSRSRSRQRGATRSGRSRSRTGSACSIGACLRSRSGSPAPQRAGDRLRRRASSLARSAASEGGVLASANSSSVRPSDWWPASSAAFASETRSS